MSLSGSETPRGIRRLLRLPSSRDRLLRDLDDEMRFHLEMRVRDLEARGMSRPDAETEALRRLGDADELRDWNVRRLERHAPWHRVGEWLAEWGQDLRYTVRQLRKAPAFTVTALVTIALGVGATTTLFSIADALLVRPMPYRDASRVFVLRRVFTVGGDEAFNPMSAAAVREWREHARLIESAVPFSRGEGPLGDGADALPVAVAAIDTGFLGFAGAHPVIGRNFTVEESAPNGPAVMLLGEHLWRRQYGASFDVLGKVVPLGGRARTIVGVMPASLSVPDFRFAKPDVWIPISPVADRNVPGVIVRLKPGVSQQAATAEAEAIFKPAQVSPSVLPGGIQTRMRLTRPQDKLAFRQALIMLTGAVALLLLVACTNVAHLLLARGAARQRELAVRYALGAGRGRLVRQLVNESVLLAMIGGALAVFVGWGGLHLVAATRPASLTALSHVTTDRGIVSITAVLAIVAGLGIGLISAVRSAHRDLGASLRLSATSTPLGVGRLRAALVVGEVALSATLLVGALLLIHAVYDLQRTRLGFEPRGLYAVSIRSPGVETPAQRLAFAARLRERAARLPGTQGVTIGDAPTRGSWVFLSSFETPERPAVRDRQSGTALKIVAPDYFSMMGMTLSAGRTFDAGSLARNEVIISSSLAREIWPDGRALGGRFRNVLQRPIEPWRTVIGVVPDVVANLVEGAGEPEVYRPLDGTTVPTLIVRMESKDAASLLGQLAASIQPDRSTITVVNVRDQIDQTVAEPRFTMLILMIFAALGVLLAAIGLFGVISYSVGQRTREIGVRMTLGATPRAIARLVVGEGVRLALIGVGLGLLGAVAATRLIQSVLYGVSRFDPFAFGVGAILLLVTSVVACLIPMWRATSVDPVIAVRAE